MPSLVWFTDITILRGKQVPDLQVYLIAEGHKLVAIPVFAKINSPRCAFSAWEDPVLEVASMAVPSLFAGVGCILKKER
jgi:hypothetical protein